MNELKIYDNIDDVLSALAETICKVARDSIQKRGQFNFVLSGGNSPKKLFELLASESFRDKVQWSKTFFFFGDERFVPENNSQRNSLMAQKTLFQPLKIQESHIYKMDTTISPESSAEKYAEAIKRHFDNKTVEFDLILLGLGDNAHTASLFPKTDVLHETDATVKAVFVNEVEMYRITMTAPLLNQARAIAFLVFGKEKSEAVYQVLEGTDDSIELYPARLINSDEKKVQWFMDSDSASKLKKIIKN